MGPNLIVKYAKNSPDVRFIKRRPHICVKKVTSSAKACVDLQLGSQSSYGEEPELGELSAPSARHTTLEGCLDEDLLQLTEMQR